MRGSFIPPLIPGLSILHSDLLRIVETILGITLISYNEYKVFLLNISEIRNKSLMVWNSYIWCVNCSGTYYNWILRKRTVSWRSRSWRAVITRNMYYHVRRSRFIKKNRESSLNLLPFFFYNSSRYLYASFISITETELLNIFVNST